MVCGFAHHLARWRYMSCASFGQVENLIPKQIETKGWKHVWIGWF